MTGICLTLLPEGMASFYPQKREKTLITHLKETRGDFVFLVSEQCFKVHA